jgi:hypothetical protein
MEIGFTVLSYTSKIPTGFQKTLSNLYIHDQLEIPIQKTITTFHVSSVNMGTCVYLCFQEWHTKAALWILPKQKQCGYTFYFFYENVSKYTHTHPHEYTLFSKSRFTCGLMYSSGLSFTACKLGNGTAKLSPELYWILILQNVTYTVQLSKYSWFQPAALEVLML